MRLIHHDGRDIKLPEHDWKQLLKRFDARRASLNIVGYYCIRVHNLCLRYRYKCYLCPLGAAAQGTNRCTHFFDNIVGRELSKCLYMFDPVVIWSPEFDSEARQALQKIREVLATGKSV
jgi:hypothetical protein